jgi:hypothetical protein
MGSSSDPDKEENLLGSQTYREPLYHRTIFKNKHNLTSLPMKTRLERDPQQMAHCIYSIPYECGRSYTSETGRWLDVRLSKHRQNLKEGLLGKSKLAQHA